MVSNFFYKWFLEVTNVAQQKKHLEVAHLPYSREISSGTRVYPPEKPGKKAMAKLESTLQASGEVIYNLWLLVVINHC